MIQLLPFNSFLIKKYTKLSLFSRIVLAKRFSGNNPQQMDKVVKDTLKFMGPHMAEAVASQSQTHTPKTKIV